MEVREPETRAGYLLTRELEGRLGRAPAARYELHPAISLSTEAIAIDRSNVAARFNMLGRVEYALIDRSGPDHAARFTVRVSVRNVGDAEATASSKQEAETAAAKAFMERFG